MYKVTDARGHVLQKRIYGEHEVYPFFMKRENGRVFRTFQGAVNAVSGLQSRKEINFEMKVVKI